VDLLVPGLAAASSLTPGFWDWSFDPPLVLVIDLAILYWFGNRRTHASARTAAQRRLRHAYFYAGLAVLAIALASPIERLSAQLFWVHMVQHILLLVVAPPLIVLARPWLRLWRSLPLLARRSLGHDLASGQLMWLRRLSGALGRPLPSFVLFCAVVLGWHVPVMFDATLRSEALHALEHTLFFLTALMFWKQVIDSPPLHARLSELQRVVYLIGAMVVMWLLAVMLALAPHPLYAAYAQQASRPGGISALSDQQIAAGIMWVPGSITFVIVLFVYVHRWLTPAATPTLASESSSARTIAPSLVSGR
jgi:putative membrane protein